MTALATGTMRSPQTVGTATARMTRVLFAGTALTGVAFAALAVGHTSDESHVMNPVWQSVVVSALWGIPVLVLLLFWWAPLRWLRRCAIAFMAVYSFALVSWPFAQTVDYIPGGVQPWITYVLPVALFSGALVLPEIAAWGYLVVTCLAAGVLRFVADGSRSMQLPVQDTLFNLMYITVFVAIIIVTLRAGRQRDATAERTAADAVLTAASRAQDSERAHVAALTHDDVLATLLAAARSTDATASLIRGYASRALDHLDELGRVEPEPDGTILMSEFINELRATTTTLRREIAFFAPDVAGGTVPAGAARALGEAAAEALRNSLRHADSPGVVTSRAITVVVDDDALTVEIVDDGAGFDIARVSAERYGIRLSINHRMVVVGGTATIDSTPGAGTRVTLRWARRV